MRLWLQLLVCALLGLPMAIVASYAALDQNPQGEFQSYETGEWTGDLYVVFGVWWGVVALPLMALCLSIWLVRKIWSR